MNDARYRRVKHGCQPGDVPKARKIAMRENRAPQVLPWGQVLDEKCAKAFRRYVIERGRIINRRRGAQEIRQELEEEQ